MSLSESYLLYVVTIVYTREVSGIGIVRPDIGYQISFPLTFYGAGPILPMSFYGAAMAKEPVELLQGTLDLLILKTLSWGSTHGYGIARWIQHVTGDVLRVEEGSLYPALHRLEKRGLISA